MNSHSSFMKESVESHIASSDRSGIRLKSYVFSISKPIFFPPYYVALIITYVCVCSFTHSCLTLCDPTRLLCPWDFLGKNTGAGCLSLLQGILLTQGSNLGLPYCRQILYHLSHQGNLSKLGLVGQPTHYTAVKILFSMLSCFLNVYKKKSPNFS